MIIRQGIYRFVLKIKEYQQRVFKLLSFLFSVQYKEKKAKVSISLSKFLMNNKSIKNNIQLKSIAL